MMFVAASSAFPALFLACEKTDNEGFDASTDGATTFDRTNSDFFVPDTHVDPMPPFDIQEGVAFCTRLKNCCGTFDGSTFDYTSCIATMKGWSDLHAGLLVPGVKTGTRVAIDQAMATACVAGLATLSCPSIGTNEFKNVTLACSKAIVGKQVAGGPCLATIECAPSSYCDPDGGTCAPLLEAGAPCTSTEQCTYLGGPSTSLFCNNGTCTAILASDSICTADNQCQSGICFQNDAGPNCNDAGCGCKDELDWRERTCGLPFPLPPPDMDAGDASDGD